MKLSIKSPAPSNRYQKNWGDFHFGSSLQRALEAQGAEVVQHYWPQWDAEDGEDVVLVLRGWHGYVPPPDKVSILWVISHPALVTKDELDAYTLVYSASSTLRSLVRDVTSTPVELLRQCTDTALFHPPVGIAGSESSARHGIVFVASSRGARRDMAHWAIGAGTELTIVGRNWNERGQKSLRFRSYVTNEEVAEIYRSARLSLNDHWLDMRRFGIVSNRIFDCLACGVPVLSDSFPELRELFGDCLLFANNAGEYVEAMKQYEQGYDRLLEKVSRAGEQVRREYSFAGCAEQILAQAVAPPARTKHRSNPGICLLEDKERLESALRDSVVQDEQKIEDLKMDLVKLARELSQAKLEVQSLERKQREMAREHAASIARLSDDRDRLTRQASELEFRIASLLNSTSWRMTALFREVARIGKALRSRLRQREG